MSNPELMPPPHPVGQNIAHAEYPKMLYRDGGEHDIAGLKLDTCIVIDMSEEIDKVAEGWRIHATDKDAKSAASIVADKDAEIAELRRQIEEGKGVEPERRGPGRPRKEELTP